MYLSLGTVEILLEFILYDYFEKDFLLCVCRFGGPNPIQKLENRLQIVSNKTKEYRKDSILYRKKNSVKFLNRL